MGFALNMLARMSLRVTKFSVCRYCFWLLNQEEVSEQLKEKFNNISS